MESKGNVSFTCGCTAWVVLIVGNKMYCANAGDSRCVVSQNNQAVALSFDHKPSNPEEETRIKNARGYVSFDRVNGNLNLSRALGDFVYKETADMKLEEQMVIPIPEIKTHTIDESTNFFIIACDGIWDWMSNKTWIDFIHEKHESISATKGSEFKISDLNEEIFEKNIAKDSAGTVSETGKDGSGWDNMTSVIVYFK